MEISELNHVEGELIAFNRLGFSLDEDDLEQAMKGEAAAMLRVCDAKAEACLAALKASAEDPDVELMEVALVAFAAGHARGISTAVTAIISR
jgi:hypothetical protein